MQRRWPQDALEFERAVHGALSRAGGLELARRCEADPALRRSEVEPLVDSLGLLDLDVRGSLDEAAAAALAMRAAGSMMCPWPLVATLVVPAGLRPELKAIHLGAASTRRAEHLDLLDGWAALDVSGGRLRSLEALGEVSPVPLDPFGVRCRTGAQIEADADVGDLLKWHVSLSAFWVSGALSRVRGLTVRHARDREQFGRPISRFGAVQWHLSDIGVSHDGLAELAAFTLLRVAEGRATIADVLALRLATLEAAHSVLSHAHQVLGAIGLCEEHDVTVIDRHLQPVLRRPFGVAMTTTLLAQQLPHDGFDALHPIEPTLPPELLLRPADVSGA